MIKQRSVVYKKWVSWAFAAGVLVLCGSVAWASQSWIQDRRVTMEEAQALAGKTVTRSGVRIIVNDLVLHELNRYVSTVEGRAFIKNALARMENYRSLIGAKLQEYTVPEEFLAVPIIESGYENRAQDPNHKSWGAGLWMFIEPTARIYGLKVDVDTDERLDVAKETDAAMRYLSAMNLRFKSWELAILAYNIGERNLQKAIEKTESRDVWKIVRAGYENDKRYYPRFIAAIILLQNPTTLD